MAKVKSFRIHPEFGVPDKDIREFLNLCEQEGIVSVTTQYIPGSAAPRNSKRADTDPRITVIVTKLDDHPNEVRGTSDLFEPTNESV